MSFLTKGCLLFCRMKRFWIRWRDSIVCRYSCGSWAGSRAAKKLYIAVEYFEKGDLRHDLGGRVPALTAKPLERQLLEGLNVMHRNWIAHRNIRPEVLIHSPSLSHKHRNDKIWLNWGRTEHILSLPSPPPCKTRGLRHIKVYQRTHHSPNAELHTLALSARNPRSSGFLARDLRVHPCGGSLLHTMSWWFKTPIQRLHTLIEYCT